MRYLPKTVVAAAFLACATSCSVSVFTRAPSGPETVTIKEIRATETLTFSNERAAALGRIARRPELAPDEQVFLVHTALRKLTFGSNKESVIRALIQNPSFSEEAKACILDNLRYLSFSSSRANILGAINERGSLKAHPEPASAEKEDADPAR